MTGGMFAMAHDHDHDDHHGHGSELSEMQLRVRALETVLAEKGYIDPAALDVMIEAFETRIGPHNGARVVAKAWADPAFKHALIEDATKAVQSLGLINRVGDHLIAVENTPKLHNVIVCTLCSCYPWEVLGLPPVWYKSAPYRSRAVNDPRGVLADFGVKLPADTQIRVWDSTAETRFIVLPMRPAGTEGWSEDKLATLGHARLHDRHRPAEEPGGGCVMDGIHDMGGMHGFGKVEPEQNEPVFHAAWEGRCLALNRAMGVIGAWTIDEGRSGIEQLPPQVYLAHSYYGKWALRLENMVINRGLAGADEIAAGHALRPGKAVKRKLGVADVPHALTRGSFGRQAPAPARFKVGERVRTKVIHPATHTRLPRYARGRIGTIEALRGCHVFPDSSAVGAGENPQWLYTVVFDGRELWGENTDPTLTVSIDAFEPYLEAA